MVNLKDVQRRKVHYDSVDDAVADAQRLVSLQATTTGNWSAGQIFEHLALVMDKSIDGFETPPLPWIVRFLMRLFMKKRILTKPMAPGFTLPKRAIKEIVAKPIDEHEAFEHLKRAAARLKTEPGRAISPFLGPLSAEEWDQLHTRHAELHLSFISEPDD